MGIFSGDTIYTVANLNVKLFKDDYPRTMSDAVLRAISLEEDIVTHILQAKFSAFQKNLARYLSYGRTKYWRGLPESTYLAVDVNHAAVKVAIETYYTNEPVTIIQAFGGYKSLEYFVKAYIQYAHGYDPVTKELQYNECRWEYKGWHLGSADDDPGDGLGIEHPQANPNFIWIELQEIFCSGDSPGRNGKYNIVIENIPDTFSYYLAQYRIDSKPQGVYYFIHDANGAYVAGLPPIYPVSMESEYYPIASIMTDKVKIGGLEDVEGNLAKPEEYNQTDKLLTTVNIDVDEMYDAVQESPDIDDIDDVYFLFGVPPLSPEEPTIAYLILYFYDLATHNIYTKETYDFALAMNNVPESNIVEIKEDQYSFTLNYNWIAVTLHEGVVSDKEFSKIFVEQSNRVIYDDTGDPLDIPAIKGEVAQSYVAYFWQFSDTQYYSVLVHGLTAMGEISIGNVSDGAGGTVPNYMGTIKSLSDEDFIIPLNHKILTQLPLGQQEIVAYDAMHLAINAIHEEDIAWYEQAGFLTLVKVVIMFVGAYFGAMNISQAIGQLATQGVSQMLQRMALMIATKLALDWLAEEIGGVLGAFIAAAAAVALTQFSGMSMGPKGLPFADTLVQAVSGFITDFAKRLESMTIADMEDLQGEYEDFLKTKEEREAEIAAAEEGLGVTNNVYDLLYIQESYDKQDSSETPQQFYRKKLNANPGVDGFTALHSWAQNQLELPKTDPDGNLLL